MCELQFLFFNKLFSTIGAILRDMALKAVKFSTFSFTLHRGICRIANSSKCFLPCPSQI